jgi:hypothetical protein
VAESLTVAQVRALPKTSYDEVRPRLRSGDLLFTSGDYALSRLIQVGTNSAWSHVGIIIRIKEINRVLLLESVEDMGVRFAPLSKYLEDYDGEPYRGRIVIARMKGLVVRSLIPGAQFGVDMLTRPYDKEEIARITARIGLGALGIRQKPAKNGTYICSELVYECLKRAGKTIAYNSSGFISPEDVWRDDAIKFLFRIL